MPSDLLAECMHLVDLETQPTVVPVQLLFQVGLDVQQFVVA